MKYLVATFTIETTADLMQASQDLLADGAAEAGFESFEETETGLEAYVQKELFDKEMLDAYIADFPIGDTKITYEVKDAEDKDWNLEWRTGIRTNLCGQPGGDLRCETSRTLSRYEQQTRHDRNRY